MKRISVIVIICLLSSVSLIHAQAQQPFVLTVYGGLFFPSHLQYQEVYQSNSDIIYGFGIGLPINRHLMVIGDMSFFKSEALLAQMTDSISTLKYKFIHVGLLSKQPFTPSLFLRLSGGLNYNRIMQTTVGLQSSEQSVESEKKIGYFAGIGIEHLFDDGRTSLFADVMYDYRRIHDINFNGDYGGTRVVIGAHFYLF